MSEFFSFSMATILHKCQEIVDALPEEANVMEAVINLPVQYPVDTDRSRAYLIPGNDKSPLGMIHKEGELRDAFGKQACAEYNIFEILQYYANTVVDRTDEEVEQAMRDYEEAHKDS